jgi:hypothetical protein
VLIDANAKAMGDLLEKLLAPRVQVLADDNVSWEGPPGHEAWVDYVTPAPLLIAASNIVILGLVAACPIELAYWLWRRRAVGSQARRPNAPRAPTT